jgi:hypothetical protein
MTEGAGYQPKGQVNRTFEQGRVNHYLKPGIPDAG